VGRAGSGELSGLDYFRRRRWSTRERTGPCRATHGC